MFIGVMYMIEMLAATTYDGHNLLSYPHNFLSCGYDLLCVDHQKILLVQLMMRAANAAVIIR